MEIIVYSITSLFVGTTFGFVLGTASRLFFRYTFKEYVKEGISEGEHEINKQIKEAQIKVHSLVTDAHAQAAEIYRAAASEALKAGLKDMPSPPTSGLN